MGSAIPYRVRYLKLVEDEMIVEAVTDLDAELEALKNKEVYHIFETLPYSKDEDNASG